MIGLYHKHTGIGGFNQRQEESLPPQIFLTLKFVVWAKGKLSKLLPPDVRF